MPESVPVGGYEIHNDVGEGPALARPLVALDDREGERLEGAVSDDSMVMGTYLHGLFDRPAACAALLARCGMVDEAVAVDYGRHRQAELDRLADTLELHLDMERVMALLEA